MSTLTRDDLKPLNWRETRLRRAQEDSYRLLEHASDNGVKLSDDVLKSLMDISRIDPHEMTEEQEETMWRLRAMLCEMVKPAQACGLRLLEILESKTHETEPRTLSGWSGRWLVTAIFVVFSVHIYALVGTRLVNDGATKQFEAASFLGRMRAQAAMPGPERVKSTNSSAGSSSASTGAPAGASGHVAMPANGGFSSSQGYAIGMQAPGTEGSFAPLSIGEARGITKSMEVVLKQQREWLEAWNAVWRIILLPVYVALANADLPADLPAPPSSATDPHPADSFAAELDTLSDRLDRDAVTPLGGERYVADIVSREALMKYVLPMLYGALGAFVFVVRLVTNDIDRGSLRMLLSIRYRIRLLLGAIFGLIVAMLSSEQSTFVTSIPLSAVAMSFLAGYGVEAAFGFLDAVIERFREMGNTLGGAASSNAGGTRG